MLEVYGIVAEEEDAELCLGLSHGRLHYHLVLFPLATLDINLAAEEVLTLTIGDGLGQLHADAGVLLTFRNTSIEGEAVLLVFLYTDAEEAFVEKGCPLMSVARALEAYVVGVTVKGTIVSYFNVTCNLPACKSVGEVERAVLH